MTITRTQGSLVESDSFIRRHIGPSDADVQAMLGVVGYETLDALVDAAGPGSGSPLVMVELRQTGGALARGAAHHGALASLPGSYVGFSVGAVMDEASAAAAQGQLALVHGALAPHAVGTYLNFAEVETDTRSAYSTDAYARLQAVKGEYDPDGLFRANHRIGAEEDR
jgi:hypothetical protein